MLRMTREEEERTQALQGTIHQADQFRTGNRPIYDEAEAHDLLQRAAAAELELTAITRVHYYANQRSEAEERERVIRKDRLRSLQNRLGNARERLETADNTENRQFATADVDALEKEIARIEAGGRVA